MKKVKKVTKIFKNAINESYRILLDSKPAIESENNQPTKKNEGYSIEDIFNTDGSYKYEFALRTTFNKLQYGKWSNFWSEVENPKYRVRLDAKYSTFFEKDKIRKYMKQPDFEKKFYLELTEGERQSPEYLKAFYVEGQDERIHGIYDVKELLLSKRISLIMKRRYPEWDNIQESLRKEI
jgi:hypothetical protein